MTNSIELECKLKLDGEIYLLGWFELDKEPLPHCTHENITFKIWFDHDCLARVCNRPIAELENWQTVYLSHLKLSVSVSGISDRLAALVLAPNNGDDPAAAKEYSDLRDHLHQIIIEKANRLIAYLRAKNEQFWLEEFRTDGRIGPALSEHAHLPLEVITATLNEEKTFLWYPPSNPINIFMSPNKNQADPKMFRQAFEYAALQWRENQPDLRINKVFQFLADAELLFAKGHDRIAVVQAVSALEMAVNAYAKAPNAQILWSGTPYAERVNADSITKHIEHTGFSGSVRILFPLIFTEEQMPIALLTKCQQAIEQRQNIIHNAQGAVRDARSILHAVREMCERLEKLSSEPIVANMAVMEAAPNAVSAGTATVVDDNAAL